MHNCENHASIGDGFHRTSIPYVWPSTVLADNGARLAYLDLNHWIGLAKARTGHRDAGHYVRALEVARSVKDSGRWTFPLSQIHYMEMASIADARQRADVAVVMGELSGFAAMLSRPVVMCLELEAALNALLEVRDEQYSPLRLIGFGVAHTFGRAAELRIHDASGRCSVSELRNTWPGGHEAYDEWFASLELEFEGKVLAGPTEDEIPTLVAKGWNPDAARNVAQRRALQERQQAERLAQGQRWRRGRLRDIVSARYLSVETMDFLVEALTARGLTIGTAFPDRQSARAFVDSMPSADVCVTLMTHAHRNPQSRWTVNDVFDIDALSVAVAYCDIVATDKERCHGLLSSGVAGRLGTEVVATPDDLSVLLME